MSWANRISDNVYFRVASRENINIILLVKSVSFLFYLLSHMEYIIVKEKSLQSSFLPFSQHFRSQMVEFALTCPLHDLWKNNIHARTVDVKTSAQHIARILTPCLCVPSVPSEQTKSNLKVTSPEDAEHVSRRQASPNGTAPSRGDAKGSRTVPRRHTLGGARGSREILAMQPSDMDKKREAFLEHLKQKYPHHASAIMGHQERLREQVSGLREAWVCNVVCLGSHY